MRIGLDIMGGDYAPQATIAGAVLAKKELGENVEIVLIGRQELIEAQLKELSIAPESFDIVNCNEVIEMDEHPTKAVLKKTDSSIAVGFRLMKEGKIDVLASAGNTGAMLVGSMYSVNAVPGVIRPCITSVMPKENGGVNIILDVGSNADCKPDVLYQFAILGSIYAEKVYGIKNPKVGLLNIGEEEKKGNLLTQATFPLLKKATDINFVGNVEGRDIFSDAVDVIVCDGFTGNVVLKQAEAFYKIMAKRNLLDDYFSRFNYENYGGTPILGINGNVIIGHGISNDIAIKNMLVLAKDVVEKQLHKTIKTAFEND